MVKLQRLMQRRRVQGDAVLRPLAQPHQAKLHPLLPKTSRALSRPQAPYPKVRREDLHTMSAATVTSKGQITIPSDVRQALQVKAGDRVEFVQIEPGRFEVVAATRPVTDLKGLFGRPSKAVSIDDMNKAIAARGASAR